MRKLLAAVIPLAALIAALANPAAAHHREKVIPGHAFGAARFTFSPGQDERFAFRAVDRGLPEEDHGFIHYTNATRNFSYRARLVCVDVEGTTARFGYVIPNSEGVLPEIRGLGVVFQVVDNGKPGAGRDLVGYISGAAAIAAACDTQVVPSTRPITSGEITVRPERVKQKKDRKDKKDKNDHDRDDDTTDDDTTDDSDD